MHRSLSIWGECVIWGSGHLNLSREGESITIYFSQLACNRWNPSAVCASCQAASQNWRTGWFDFIRSSILLFGPRHYPCDPSQKSLRKSCTPRHCYSWGGNCHFSVFINVTLGYFHNFSCHVLKEQWEKISQFWNSRNEGAKKREKTKNAEHS